MPKFLPKNVQKATTNKISRSSRSDAAKTIPSLHQILERLTLGEPKEAEKTHRVLKKPAPLFSARPFGPWSPEFGGFKSPPKKNGFKSFVGMGHPPRKINISHISPEKWTIFKRKCQFPPINFQGLWIFAVILDYFLLRMHLKGTLVLRWIHRGWMGPCSVGPVQWVAGVTSLQIDPLQICRRFFCIFDFSTKPNCVAFIWVFPKNRGIPKSSILIGFSIINHPFWGYPYFWKHPYLQLPTT